MPRLYLIRHAEPASAWGEAGSDPGLSALGRAQAADAAMKLGALKPQSIFTSPLLRCRETAAAFEMESGLAAQVENAMAEIQTPPDVSDRRTWLNGVLTGDWRDYPDYDDWRAGALAALRSTGEDAAIFTHFVAINVVIGALQGVTATTVFRPAHASITTLDADASRMRIVALGAETAAVTVL